MKIVSQYAGFTLFFFILLIGIASGAGALNDPFIIDVKFEVKKRINPYLFGNNAIAYDPFSITPETGRTNNGQYSNFGAGQWSPLFNRPSKEPREIAKRIKVSILRFPGGSGVNHYDWKKTIGPPNERPLFQFGLDEFLYLCRSISAEPIITLSYFTGSITDYADMVEYLNQPVGFGNPNGGVNWADERVKNGHPDPYFVKFFEFGNEIYAGDSMGVGDVDPTEYALDYLDCRTMMKRIDPAVQLGIVLEGHGNGIRSWDREVLLNVRHNVDFCIMHCYPVGYRGDVQISPQNLFQIAWAAPYQIRKEIEYLAGLIRQYTGKDTPLAITEFNGDFAQEKPVPYRHSLGNALLLADMLVNFIVTDAPMLCANYWQFSNSFWGMVYNKNYMETTGNYHFRPNFYVYDLFANHFGDKLIDMTISGPGYLSDGFGNVMATVSKNSINNVSKGARPEVIQFPPETWIEKKISNIKVSKSKEEIEIDFLCDQGVRYSNLYVTMPTSEFRRYRMKGKIKTENISSRYGVRIGVSDGRGWDKTRWAHTTSSFFGTRDWREFVQDFITIKGNAEILIFVHRQSGGDALSGKLWLKDFSVEDLGPEDYFFETPYLSGLATTNEKENKLFIMIINKEQNETVTTQINVHGFPMASQARTLTLTGPSVIAVNENQKEMVNVSDAFYQIKDTNKLIYSFKPNSLTLFEIAR